MSDIKIKEGIGVTIQNSDLLTAQVHWNPQDTTFIQKINWISSIARTHKRGLIVNFDWMEKNRKMPYKGNWRFSDTLTCIRFLEDVTRTCRIYSPTYLNLGVEVNFYALSSPDDFKHFVALYNRTKKLIKDSFPHIKTSVTFQMDLLLGLMKSWNSKNSLKVLDAFGDNFDLLGLSVYPHWGAGTSNTIDNLRLIAKKTKKNIGIFETSWPTKSGNEKLQKEYLQTLLSTSNVNTNIELIIWTSIADASKYNDSASWESYLGLMDIELQGKPAMSVWNDWIKKTRTDL